MKLNPSRYMSFRNVKMKGANIGNIATTTWFKVFAISVILAIVYILILHRFYIWSPKVFYGDDLDYYIWFLDGTCGTHLDTMFVASCNERFRPLAFAFISGLNSLFGTRMIGYFLVNAAIQESIFIISFLIAYRLSKNWKVALVLSAAIALSRFATYGITQVIGPIESLSCLFALICAYFSIHAEKGCRGYRDYTIAVICAVLAILAHERYVVLSLWLCVVFASAPVLRQSVRWKLGLIVASLLVPVCYVLYKNIVLHASFLIGTGGTHLSLNLKQILLFAWDAVRSMLGLNTGEAYLVGLNIDPDAGIAAVLGWLLCAGTLVVVAFGLGKGLRAADKWASLRWPIMLIFLAALVLGPGLLTIRLEQRWIYTPFILCVLALSYWIGQMRPIRGFVVALLLAVTSITLDSAIMAYYSNVFFISSPRFAGLVRHDVLENHGLHLLPGEEIAFVAEQSQCRWSLLNGKFFRVYEGAERPVRCFDSIDSVVRAKLPGNTLVFVERDGSLVDMTADYLALRSASVGSVSYDFLDSFDAGVINSNRIVDTPSGRGVMLMPWKSVTGPRRTLTVLSGFTYQFPDVPVAAGDHLRFGVTMVFHAPQSARAIVKALLGNGEIITLFSKDLSIPKRENAREFVPVDLDLSRLVGNKAAIVFAVESPGGNSSSQWVAFADPRIQTVTRARN